MPTEPLSQRFDRLNIRRLDRKKKSDLFFIFICIIYSSESSKSKKDLLTWWRPVLLCGVCLILLPTLRKRSRLQTRISLLLKWYGSCHTTPPTSRRPSCLPQHVQEQSAGSLLHYSTQFHGPKPPGHADGKSGRGTTSKQSRPGCSSPPFCCTSFTMVAHVAPGPL